MKPEMCDRCPRRDAANTQRALALLSESLGENDVAKKLREDANEIESSGCPWWWGLEETHTQTKMVRTVYDCGAQHIARLLFDQGSLVKEALQTAQSQRNEIEKGMEAVVKAIEENTRKVTPPLALFSIAEDQIPTHALTGRLHGE